MSRDETSEERSLPPSERKLKELRKKAHIARSSDMVAGAGTSAAFIFLWLEGGAFIQNFKLSIMALTISDWSDFHSVVVSAVKILAVNLGSYVAMLMAVVLSVVLLANLLVNRGILFSFDPMKFDLNRMNPIEGLKRILSVRTSIELLKNISRVSFFLLFSFLFLASNFNVPFQIPFCGTDCFQSTYFSITNPILIVAIVIFLFSGIIDVGIQQWLFLRRQKMTKTEAKRDRKEEEGSPEVRSSQRRLRQQLLQQSRHYTLRDATIFIVGAETIVGVRFVRGETAVPIVVSKGRGEKILDIKDFALESKIPSHADEELADSLFQRLEVGQPLTEQFFEPFIRAMMAAGIL